PPPHSILARLVCGVSFVFSFILIAFLKKNVIYRPSRINSRQPLAGLQVCFQRQRKLLNNPNIMPPGNYAVHGYGLSLFPQSGKEAAMT
ncbi:MAG: hypothetical protein LBC27_02050, partial [Spirochaetaceae bacterium]|nr:hypothetical protein [Spirochaetaceae bacterium]